jgi:chromosome segregation ATPase
MDCKKCEIAFSQGFNNQTGVIEDKNEEIRQLKQEIEYLEKDKKGLMKRCKERKRIIDGYKRIISDKTKSRYIEEKLIRACFPELR